MKNDWTRGTSLNPPNNNAHLYHLKHYPSPSYNKTPNPTQIIPTPIKVCKSGMWPIHTASTTATRPMVRRLATEDVVGPQIPIRTIRPAFCSLADIRGGFDLDLSRKMAGNVVKEEQESREGEPQNARNNVSSNRSGVIATKWSIARWNSPQLYQPNEAGLYRTIPSETNQVDLHTKPHPQPQLPIHPTTPNHWAKQTPQTEYSEAQ